MADTVYTKHNFGRTAEWEVAGLRWLGEAEANGGARIVEVHGWDDNAGIHLQKVHIAAPTREAAENFGRQLAHTHLSGAPAFGSGPKGWERGPLPGAERRLVISAIGNLRELGRFLQLCDRAPLGREGTVCGFSFYR